jgi:two-component system, NarL family, competent response regulator ComA
VRKLVKILVVDDHQLVGIGTQNILEKEDDFEVMYLFEVEEVLKEVSTQSFDIYLLDIHMPNSSGIELSKKILDIHSDAKVILYTGFDYTSQFNLLVEANIKGIVSKSVSYQDLIINIRAVLNGYTLIPSYLLKYLRLSDVMAHPNRDSHIIFTQKEIDILEGLLKGDSNKVISEQLFMSTRAIEYNLTKIYKKLNVKSRTEAISETLRLGLVPR